MLKYAILGYLNYRPMFGYELKQAMDGSTSFFWHSKLSQIYMTLKSLEKEKKLKSEIENQEDKPDRKRYTITKLGKEDLNTWLETPLTDIPQNKDELLLKLFFSANQDKKSILSELRIQKKLHENQLNTYINVTAKVIKDAKKENPACAKDSILWEATRRMGELYEKAYIQWIDETIRVVESKL
ncbi:MAG TPA: PadR family transcriptional regulator [Leptospiraceae bacterium]|nr:PadR family transcriptional regulator [Leptospiraceae bacterium]HMW04183.1 PadR family transcriptional regulator [Leptospiraceae bacterium]HMX32715.1 PadR family transcriptional regulator [Leptospiraceae bacterium]HMY30176.1 PadR family transcriptional regulator [Leptospiraceae bacterium]HMZ65159.1 PadR family transcriptional regulator [Leptospiraceae bacterium]